MQTLVKSQGTRFRASIVDNIRSTHERRHTGNCHHMAMILLDHGWKELSHHPEVRDSVDLERLLDNLFSAI
jgi:hypothetical protein